MTLFRVALYGTAALTLCAAPLLLALPAQPDIGAIITELLEQGRVPNLVSTVILHTRLYDTIAEVVVFTLASIGVRWIFSGEPQQRRVLALDDVPSVVLCQLGATMCALVAVELALRGHLSPGGGFAAGVAGGTAIGLLLISGSARLTDRLYRRYRADLWEKAADARSPELQPTSRAADARPDYARQGMHQACSHRFRALCALASSKPGSEFRRSGLGD